MANRSIKQNFELLGKGALIGVANTVPGVSGGTIAVVTGIYDELMESIAHFIKSWKFLAILILGAGSGILIFARVIEYLMIHFPFQTLYAFIGLILGGLPFLWNKAAFGDRLKPVWIVGFVLSFMLILLMGWGSEPGETSALTKLTAGTALLVFTAGMLAAAAMIIPGISGSFLMLLLGVYSTFIGAVNNMNLPILLVASAGMAVGIILVARAMTFFLNRFPHMTYAVILGLVTGSVVTLWPGFSTELSGILGLLLIPAGAVAGYFLGDR
jgi:putative membrane protein